MKLVRGTNQGGSNREGTKRESLKSLLLGILVLAFAYHNFFVESGFNDVVESISSPKKKNSSHRDDDEIERLRRFSKYHETYRYLGPASRYDYVKVPDESCGDGPDFGPWWKLGVYQRSSKNEDKIIYETFFKDSGPDFKGTYLELGAFNGIQESNTRFFDICLGWKGLLIEGNPPNYQKILETRPHAHKMSLAPSCSAEYEAVNKTVPFYRYPITNVGLVGHAKSYEGKPTVDVPCGPLQPILEDIFADNHGDHSSGLPTLDFFSLDVEGAEALVLSTIDFQAVRINVLMIEIENNLCPRNYECEVRNKVRAKMEQEGYTRYQNFLSQSDVYVHPKSPFQIPEDIAKPTWAPKD